MRSIGDRVAASWTQPVSAWRAYSGPLYSIFGAQLFSLLITTLLFLGGCAARDDYASIEAETFTTLQDAEGDPQLQDPAQSLILTPSVDLTPSPSAAMLPADSTESAQVAPTRMQPAPTTLPAHASCRRGRACFLGQPDEPIREALRRGRVETVIRGRGGRSLGFRLQLDNGAEGYFKPEQTFNGMGWQAELAAYHFDRMLHFNRVAAVVERRLDWADLKEAAGDDNRVQELVIDSEGRIRGSLIYWVPERLVPLHLPTDWVSALRCEALPGNVDPFQRPGPYRRAMAAVLAEHTSIGTMLEVSHTLGQEPLSPGPTATEAAARADESVERLSDERLAELSDMIVFDYLVHNGDRWGTRNTNIRVVGRGGPLMFLDNAASFRLRRDRIDQLDERLHRVQRFSGRLLARVTAFDIARFEARLAAAAETSERPAAMALAIGDPGDPEDAPLLDARQLENLEVRRAHFLAYVAELRERFGDERVLLP